MVEDLFAIIRPYDISYYLYRLVENLEKVIEYGYNM